LNTQSQEFMDFDYVRKVKDEMFLLEEIKNERGLAKDIEIMPFNNQNHKYYFLAHKNEENSENLKEENKKFKKIKD